MIEQNLDAEDIGMATRAATPITSAAGTPDSVT